MTANYTTTLSLPIDLLEEEFWANEHQWDCSQEVPILRDANAQFEGVGNVVYNQKKMLEELILRLFDIFAEY